MALGAASSPASELAAALANAAVDVAFANTERRRIAFLSRIVCARLKPDIHKVFSKYSERDVVEFLSRSFESAHEAAFYIACQFGGVASNPKAWTKAKRFIKRHRKQWRRLRIALEKELERAERPLRAAFGQRNTLGEHPSSGRNPIGRDVLRAGGERIAEETHESKLSSQKQEPAVRSPNHGSDFSWINVGEERFTFRKGNESKVIEILWEEWERAGKVDGAGLSQETIGEKIGSNAAKFSIKDTFRSHMVVKAGVLAPCGKGQWALFVNTPRNTNRKRIGDPSTIPSGRTPKNRRHGTREKPPHSS